MICACILHRTAAGRRAVRSPRPSASAARVLGLASFVAAIGLAAMPGPARAQSVFVGDDYQGAPVVVGGASGGVSVDLSVLDDLDRPGGDRQLLFPGAQAAPGTRVQLYPPGTKPRLTKPKPRKVAKARKAAPKAKPSAKPSDAAPPTAAAPPPPPAASEAPKAVAPALPESSPLANPADAVGQRSTRDSLTANDRAAVPPPPPPSAMPRQPSSAAPSEMPPVAAAPRASVDSGKLAAPAPAAPPRTTAVKAPEPPAQTAALPPEPPSPQAAPKAAAKAAAPVAGGFAPGVSRAIAFAAGQAQLPADGEPILKAAAQAIAGDPKLRIELKAYAKGEKNNESQARRLSLSRALSVRSYLIKEGVQATRIDVRALGSQVPDGAADRVDVSVVAR